MLEMGGRGRGLLRGALRLLLGSVRLGGLIWGLDWMVWAL